MSCLFCRVTAASISGLAMVNRTGDEDYYCAYNIRSRNKVVRVYDWVSKGHEGWDCIQSVS